MAETDIKASLKTTRETPMKDFRDFGLGDFLLPCDDGNPNGAIGIKVGTRSIRWIRGYSGDSDAITNLVEPTNLYAVPTSVTIEAVL